MDPLKINIVIRCLLSISLIISFCLISFTVPSRPEKSTLLAGVTERSARTHNKLNLWQTSLFPLPSLHTATLPLSNRGQGEQIVKPYLLLTPPLWQKVAVGGKSIFLGALTLSCSSRGPVCALVCVWMLLIAHRVRCPMYYASTCCSR